MTDSGRGGKRAGAGRKAERGEKTAPIVVRVKESNKDWLMEESERTGKKTGEVLDHLIETHRPEDRLPEKTPEQEKPS